VYVLFFLFYYIYVFFFFLEALCVTSPYRQASINAQQGGSNLVNFLFFVVIAKKLPFILKTPQKNFEQNRTKF